MNKKINKGHENVTKQSAASKAEGTTRFKKRLDLLQGLIQARKEAFIPMGDLPHSISSFMDGNDWLPEGTDIEACKVTKNLVYATHNILLRKELEKAILVIKKPVLDKKKFNEQDMRIKELEMKVVNLAATNLKLENKYKSLIDSLRLTLEQAESDRDRYKQLLDNKASVIPFPR
ncbi:TPA: hypothetical protein KDX74_003953 [Vibrio parahaemolyticus]|nr:MULTISPECIES: hypothetical protein [Vibrio harveyi group]MDF4635219.1 hypothetical protein [Vibrio parahaemolyticus]MDG2619286.1 hypothetical protein [Vibrio parahaemolyticus]HBH7879292.1 hypothetical protein [Vibrio parahaemolyticus]HBK3326354.1 hypothetical protein [Vibrio parahaemolyticus]